MSIVHDGPGPRCFEPPLYDALTKGVTVLRMFMILISEIPLRL